MRNQELYQKKLCTIGDVLSSIQDGDIICGGGEMCEPVTFYNNFHRVAVQRTGLELIKGKRGSGYISMRNP
jgi:hypothetical protein